MVVDGVGEDFFGREVVGVMDMRVVAAKSVKTTAKVIWFSGE
jgi:hypothetical protein